MKRSHKFGSVFDYPDLCARSIRAVDVFASKCYIQLTHCVSGRIYFDVGQTKPKIILEGYSYYLYSKKTERTIWLCTGYYYMKGATRCKAKVLTCGKVATIMGYHTHPETISRHVYENMSAENIVIARDPRDDIWKYNRHKLFMWNTGY